ncbi:MAG: TetR/AcrR family transcriptional regulator [Pseudomonadota bacterium]|nr:TetR/AcrR family transcriptional regulator [Pseudomonadota bacterium]
MVNTAQTRASPSKHADLDTAATSAPRRRLSAQTREQQIVEGATDFFARRGLDAQMRELAAELGIAHTLLYHYFPTKRQLIERVYEETIAGRWNPQWEALLDDARRPAQDKLHGFYRAYLAAILTPEWLRILVHSGLSDSLIPNRYFALLRERLFPRLLRELRRHAGSRSRAPATPREEALLMSFHGGLIYHLGLWPLIYQQRFTGADDPALIDTFIADRVQGLLLQAALFVPSSTPRRATPKPESR